MDKSQSCVESFGSATLHWASHASLTRLQFADVMFCFLLIAAVGPGDSVLFDLSASITVYIEMSERARNAQTAAEVPTDHCSGPCIDSFFFSRTA